jgi:hypothetical protein
MRLLASFVFLTIAVWGSVSGQQASKRSLVANLKNKAVADGCGCYFQFPGTPRNAERYLFFSSIEDDEKTAWMNVAGRDVKLTLVKKTDPKGRIRVGSRLTRTYVAGDLSAEVTYIATRVCPRNDESCEVTDYSATFVVKKGGRLQAVKAVGGCGC